MSSTDRRRFLQLAAGAAAALPSCSKVEQAGQSRQRKLPNVVFLFSDQQHARTVSAYGGTPVLTPNIDRLAREGRRFDNSISTYPVCSPYRGMLLTGLSPMHNGVVGNDTPLPDNLPTFGKLFRDAGYRTGYIGKWHLESTRRGFVPPARRQGFDDFWAVHSCNHEHFYSPYYRDDPNRELTHRGYEPHSQAALAIELIRQSAQTEKPFCLVLSFGPPHGPYKAPRENERRFRPEEDIPLPANVNEREVVDELLRTDNRPITKRQARSRANHRAVLDNDLRIRRRILRGYYGACEALDVSVGRILDALDDLNLADDTIVVYTSDHGDMVGSHRMLSKQLPFEESIHTPFLLRYPRSVEAGSSTAALLEPTDILPTLLSLAGVEYEAEAFDGRDRSQATGEDREAILLMKLVHGGNPWIMNGVRPWRGVRTSRYTYAEHEGSPWLLYDNQEDPDQLHNLIRDTERTALCASLSGEMRRMMVESDDTMTEQEIDDFRRRRKAEYRV